MRIVLAYSGSPAGSAAIVWLREQRRAEVVTVTVDLGQGRALEATRDRALSLGALRAHVLDARDEFLQDIVVPALRADATHAGGVPMTRALSRPIVARKLAEIARIERATQIAHTGQTTDGVSRLDTLLAGLAPTVVVQSLQREWPLSADARDALLLAHGASKTATVASTTDVNLWGRSCDADSSDTSAFVVRSADQCPSEPATIDIAFTQGVPTALNGVPLPLSELIVALSTLAATHGVGLVRNAQVVCDAPAAVILHAAHRDLTLAVAPPDVAHFSAAVTAAYVDLIERARWFSPLREALDAYVNTAQRQVTGRVQMRLHKGTAATVAVERAQPATRLRVMGTNA